jgi:hypothetical protein
MQLTVTMTTGRQRAALPLISWHVHDHMGGDALPEPECLTRPAADKEGLSAAWRVDQEVISA